MVNLKVYELLAMYPGSPDVGEKVLECKNTNGKTVKYILLSSIDKQLKSLEPKDVEDFPQFWKLQEASV